MTKYVYEPENLIAGSAEIVTEPVTVAISQNLALGQVVTKNEDGDVVAATVATDIYGIIADPVITNGTTKGVSVIYIAGEFNKRKISIPEGGNKAEYSNALRKIGIYLKNAEGNGVTYA
ncbi:hypothetical protein [Viridibacillus arvi]|uniref:hypothetical protein n=1 Tax=Viridibacillus arvi TaxID=263475 RepID=UPI0034CFDD61